MRSCVVRSYSSAVCDKGTRSCVILHKYDAPPGKMWICAACGKQSLNRADGIGKDGASYRGWDESCFLNAVLQEQANESGKGDQASQGEA